MLTSCAFTHRMDIEQGNILTPDMVSKIHTGMTSAQVKDTLGEPILTNVFDNSRLDYVYTMKVGHQKVTEKQITLIMRNDRVSEIKGNMYSTFMKTN